MTQLNKELAELIGWTYTLPYTGGTHRRYTDANGKVYDGIGETPFWTSDMDACLRDLLPVLREKGLELLQFDWSIKSEKVCCTLSFDNVYFEGKGPTIPESFCKAVREVLRG